MNRLDRAARLTSAVLALAALQACHRSPAPAAPPRGQALEIIALPHGTIAVHPGSPEEQLAKFLASNDPPPRTFRFPSTNFAPWSDQLSPATRGTLTSIMLILRDYPTAKVTFTGYTDNDGDPAANQALSERRADALRRLLTDQGIAASRLTIAGRGPADPVASNATKAGQALNRRIELTVTER